MYSLFSYSFNFDPSLRSSLLISTAAIQDHIQAPASCNDVAQHMTNNSPQHGNKKIHPTDGDIFL